MKAQHYVGDAVCIEPDSGLIRLGTEYILHERRGGRGGRLPGWLATDSPMQQKQKKGGVGGDDLAPG